MSDDLYKELGIPVDASEQVIKKAYRKLANQYHPDKNNGDKTAEEKFKKIKFAYEVLKDKDKRAEYDRTGKTGTGKKKTFEEMVVEVFLKTYEIALEGTLSKANPDLMRETTKVLQAGMKQLKGIRKAVTRKTKRVERTVLRKQKRPGTSAKIAVSALQAQLVNFKLRLDQLELEERVGHKAIKLCDKFEFLGDDEEGDSEEEELMAAFKAAASF